MASKKKSPLYGVKSFHAPTAAMNKKVNFKTARRISKEIGTHLRDKVRKTGVL